MINWPSLIGFSALLDTFGIKQPELLARATQLMEVSQSVLTKPVGILDLADDQVRQRVVDLSIRGHKGANPMRADGLTTGVDDFQEQLVIETRDAMLPELDRILDDLRPAFDDAAAPLVDAVERFGFTWQTTSDQVINMADDHAVTAWRAVRDARNALNPLLNLRTEMSKVFEVSPTLSETQSLILGPAASGRGVVNIDYSITVAAGDNWSPDGDYYVNGQVPGTLDWLKIAAGGLHLNTFAEVHQKQTKGMADWLRRQQEQGVLDALDQDLKPGAIYPVTHERDHSNA